MGERPVTIHLHFAILAVVMAFITAAFAFAGYWETVWGPFACAMIFGDKAVSR